MSFFKKLLGGGETSDAERAQRDFDTLRDDGVRALAIGELDYAARCLQAALDLKEDTAAAGYLAEVFLRRQEFDRAVPLLRQLAGKEEEGIEVHLHLLAALGHCGGFEEMKQICDDLLSAHVTDSRICYYAARAAHGLHDDLAAIALLTQAIIARPDFSEAQFLRAAILTDMGQFEEARKDVELILAADGNNEDYLLLQVRTQVALGRMEEAEQTALHLRRLNPFHREVVLLLGAVYEQTGRLDKALSLCDEALELQPDFAEAYKLRGGVKHRLHDDAGAAEDLKRSLELNPESASQLDGEYTNVENRMAQYYRNLNPYGF